MAQAPQFEWTGLYPGISDDGNHIAFVGSVGEDGCLTAGPGLFLSSFANGQWVTRRVLGTNDHLGQPLFQRFHEYYRTCVATLDTQPEAVKICFGAASPTGRVGLYAAVYNYAGNQVTSLGPLIEAGTNFLGLGFPISFDFSDSVNSSGEVAFWVRTQQTDVVAVLAARQIDAIDPFPELLDNGIITAEPVRLAHSTNLVAGLAADGVTRVVLRVEAPPDMRTQVWRASTPASRVSNALMKR